MILTTIDDHIEYMLEVHPRSLEPIPALDLRISRMIFAQKESPSARTVKLLFEYQCWNSFANCIVFGHELSPEQHAWLIDSPEPNRVVRASYARHADPVSDEFIEFAFRYPHA